MTASTAASAERVASFHVGTRGPDSSYTNGKAKAGDDGIGTGVGNTGASGGSNELINGSGEHTENEEWIGANGADAP